MSDAYMETIARLEPVIAMIDPGAFYASAAISLKRIADALQPDRGATIEFRDAKGGIHILQQVNNHDSRNVYRGTIGEVILT